MQRPSLCRKLAFALCCLLAPATLFAQSEYGNITGVVTDPNGAVMPGAEVTITATATNATKTTVSGEGGQYNIPVAPGAYRIQVSLRGFKKYLADNVVVAAATTV